MARPITDDDYRAVKRLHARGMSRNDIARRLNRSGQTISKIANELGLSFTRGPEVQAAIEARKVDAKAMRTQLAIRLLEDAERLRRSLWEQAEYIDHGGKEFVEARWTRSQPVYGDQRNIMQAAGIAIDRAIRLDEYDRDTDGGDLKSVIGDLMVGLKQAWHDAQPTE